MPETVLQEPQPDDAHVDPQPGEAAHLRDLCQDLHLSEQSAGTYKDTDKIVYAPYILFILTMEYSEFFTTW